MKCSRVGCERGAEYQVLFKVWSHAVAPSNRNEGNAILIATTFLICDKHREDVRLDDLATPPVRRTINRALIANGIPMPDYASLQHTLSKIKHESLVGGLGNMKITMPSAR